MNLQLVALFIIAGNLLAVAGLFVARQRVPLSVLKANHEVATALITVFGTAYGVLLAFVTSAVWNQFEVTRVYVAQEANSLADIQQLATGFPQTDADRIHAAVAAYAKYVVDDEWPSLTGGPDGKQGGQKLNDIWSALLAAPATSQGDNAIYSAALNRMTDVSDNRRQRIAAAHTQLPLSLWIALIGGGIILIVFTYAFGLENTRVQAVMVAALATTIGWLLFVIVLLSNPYNAGTIITPDPFVTIMNGGRQ